jgi:hypothetical protein
MTIDYFEFTVLVEASWYSGTILRHSIVEKAINVWYRDLTWKERASAFEFFNRTQKAETEIQRRFLARFDPNNQYRVESAGKGLKRTDILYLFDGEYWDSTSSVADAKFIKKIEKVDTSKLK